MFQLDMQFPEPRHLEKMMLAKSFSDRMGGRIQLLLSHNSIIPRDKPFVISVGSGVLSELYRQS